MKRELTPKTPFSNVNGGNQWSQDGELFSTSKPQQILTEYCLYLIPSTVGRLKSLG